MPRICMVLPSIDRFYQLHLELSHNPYQNVRSRHIQVMCLLQPLWRNRQTLWGGRTNANPKLLLNDT